MTTHPDLAAAGDVVRDLVETIDSLNPEQALALRTALEGVQAEVRTALSMLDSHLLNTLEQPAQVGDTVYMRKRTYKKRPLHDEIKRLLVNRSTVDLDTGELIDTPRAAAERAVALTYDLFVSPSTVPKVAGVKQLKADYGDVVTEEFDGYKVVAQDVG